MEIFIGISRWWYRNFPIELKPYAHQLCMESHNRVEDSKAPSPGGIPRARSGPGNCQRVILSVLGQGFASPGTPFAATMKRVTTSRGRGP